MLYKLRRLLNRDSRIAKLDALLDKDSELTDGLLYILPAQPASPTPVIDHITRRMCAAFRKAKSSDWFCGIHECCCGAQSTACDYRLPNGDLTNSLCVHYLAHHRSEVPPHELRRIELLQFGEIDPNDQELQGPELVLERVRARVGRERLCTWTAWGLDVESLVQGLTGGVVDSNQGVAQDRLDAEILLDILDTITIDGLSVVKEVVQRDHCDMRTWGEEALRAFGWKREVWVTPLMAIIERAESDPMLRRTVATRLGDLGPAAGTALPTLIKLRKGATGDLKYDLNLALDSISRIPNVSISPETVPGLVEIAEGTHYDTEFRIQAARILGCAGLGIEVAVPVLLWFALNAPKKKDRKLAESVLFGTLDQKKGLDRELGINGWNSFGLPLLLEALQDPDVMARRRVIDLLGRLGPEASQAIPALETLVQSPFVRSEARIALLRITASDSAEKLIAKIESEDKAKAHVVAPRTDANKPRRSQFFQFVCPFCDFSEELGVWNSLRQCPQCRKSIRIVKQD